MTEPLVVTFDVACPAAHAWERLGADGPARRDRNRAGWSGLLPHYLAAIDAALEGEPR